MVCYDTRSIGVSVLKMHDFFYEYRSANIRLSLSPCKCVISLSESGKTGGKKKKRERYRLCTISEYCTGPGSVVDTDIITTPGLYRMQIRPTAGRPMPHIGMDWSGEDFPLPSPSPLPLPPPLLIELRYELVGGRRW